MLYRIPTSKRRVFITFDDGPHPEYTGRILDILGEYGARATFFPIGWRATTHSTLVKRMVAEGHTLGNHSQTHAVLPRAEPAILRAEIDQWSQAIEEAGGGPGVVRFFRPPHGKWGLRELIEIKKRNLRLTMWSVDSINRLMNDPPQALSAFRNHALSRGDIILLHDIEKDLPGILPDVLAHIRNQGWECAALHESEIA